MKGKSKVLVPSIATMAVCASLVTGGTYALFTSESKVDISVTSGKVQVEAVATNLNADLWDGSANLEAGYVSIDRMVPGDSVSFNVEVTNYSNVAAKYRTIVQSTEDGGLADALTVSFTKADGKEIAYYGGYGLTTWAEIAAADEDGETIEALTVTIDFKDNGEKQDEYQDKSCKYQVLVEAVQGNADTVDPIEEDENNALTWNIYNEQGMQLMTSIANAYGPNEPYGEAFLNFNLMNDLDMKGYEYTPHIRRFVNFNGNNKTIKNLTAGYTAGQVARSGLFAYGTNIKDVTLENMTAKGAQAALILASGEGQTISNVTIKGNNVVEYVEAGNDKPWYAIGAFVAVNNSNNISGVTVDTGATITLKYNDMLTGCPYVADDFGGCFYNVVTGVTNNGTIVKDGEWWYSVNDGETLKTGLANGWNVKMINDIHTIANTKAPYGNDYGVWQNGGVLDGQGYTLFVEGTRNSNNKFDDYAIMTSGGTIKNLTIGDSDGNVVDCFRGIVIMQLNGAANSDLNLENVTVNSEDCVYTLNTTEIFEKVTVNATGCKFYGYMSFANLVELNFTNCNFYENTYYGGGDFDRMVRAYEKTTFTNCHFCEDFYLDCSAFKVGKEGYFFNDGCTVGGVELTTENLMLLFGTDVEDSYNDWKFGGEVDAEYVPIYVDGELVSVRIGIADGFSMDENGNYVISSASGLTYFANTVNNGEKYSGKTVLVSTDIDMSGVAWTVINPVIERAGVSPSFQGTFDGQNKKISNLTANGTANVGLFGRVYNATIQNVWLDNATVTGNDYVGGVVGQLLHGTVKDCKVTNSSITATPYEKSTGVYDGGAKAGGVVGHVVRDGSTVKVEKCAVDTVTVTAYRDLGGVAGMSNNAADVTACEVKNVTLNIARNLTYCEDTNINAGYVVGRITTGTLSADNVVSGDNVMNVSMVGESELTKALALNTTNLNLTLGDGRYENFSTSNKTINVTGTKNAIVVVPNGNGNHDHMSLRACTVTFDGISVNFEGDYYTAFIEYKKITYKDCTLNGQVYLYGDVDFIGCEINLGNGYVFTYGASVVNVTGCTFNSANGKALIMYQDNGTAETTLTVTGTTFNADASGTCWNITNQACAAIEIDNSKASENPSKFTLILGDDNKYDVADGAFSGIWRIKAIAPDSVVTINSVEYTNAIGDVILYNGTEVKGYTHDEAEGSPTRYTVTEKA